MLAKMAELKFPTSIAHGVAKQKHGTKRMGMASVRLLELLGVDVVNVVVTMTCRGVHFIASHDYTFQSLRQVGTGAARQKRRSNPVAKLKRRMFFVTLTKKNTGKLARFNCRPSRTHTPAKSRGRVAVGTACRTIWVTLQVMHRSDAYDGSWQTFADFGWMRWRRVSTSDSCIVRQTRDNHQLHPLNQDMVAEKKAPEEDQTHVYERVLVGTTQHNEDPDDLGRSVREAVSTETFSHQDAKAETCRWNTVDELDHAAPATGRWGTVEHVARVMSTLPIIHFPKEEGMHAV